MDRLKGWFAQLKSILRYLFLRRGKRLLLKINIIATTMTPLSLEVLSKPDNLSYQMFQPGDIVFVLFNPQKDDSSPANPTYGSPHEIDCKILRVHPLSADNKALKVPDVLYELISGHGAFFTSKGRYLVLAKDIDKYAAMPTAEALVDTELCDKGIRFLRKGDYFCQESLGIYIHVSRIDELVQKAIFKLL